MRAVCLVVLLVATAAHAFPMTPVTSASFVFDFAHVPYANGVRHIHMPEHVETTHRLGAPFFRLNTVDWPVLGEQRASIRFTCSTLVTHNMHIRMFTSAANESKLLFFDNDERRALYMARFVVVPTNGYTGHRMHLFITLFRGTPLWRAAIVMLMPLFLFVNGLEDSLAFRMPEKEVPQLRKYRSHVLQHEQERIV